MTGITVTGDAFSTDAATATSALRSAEASSAIKTVRVAAAAGPADGSAATATMSVVRAAVTSAA